MWIWSQSAGTLSRAGVIVARGYAGRGRVQASGLIDLATATKVRAYPLRDVLCRR